MDITTTALEDFESLGSDLPKVCDDWSGLKIYLSSLNRRPSKPSHFSAPEIHCQECFAELFGLIDGREKPLTVRYLGTPLIATRLDTISSLNKPKDDWKLAHIIDLKTLIRDQRRAEMICKHFEIDGADLMRCAKKVHKQLRAGKTGVF